MTASASKDGTCVGLFDLGGRERLNINRMWFCGRIYVIALYLVCVYLYVQCVVQCVYPCENCVSIYV